MVVTRKPLVPSPGPVSRTPSSTSTPKNKGKSTHETVSSPLKLSPSQDHSPNDEETKASSPKPSVPKSSKTKARAKGKMVAKKKGKGPGWLYWLFLIIFSTYTYQTCTKDYTLENHLCRTLSVYKSNLLEPPFRAIVHHPSVAPQLLRLEPAITRGLDTYYSLAARTAPYANYLTQRTLHLVTPVWTKQVEPRIQRIKAYLTPHWRKIEQNYVSVYPFIDQLGSKLSFAVAKVEPKVTASLRASEPYLRKFFVTVRSIPDMMFRRVYAPLADARQRNVDPYLLDAYERIVLTLVRYKSSYIDPHVATLTSHIHQLGGEYIPPTPSLPSNYIFSSDLESPASTEETVAAEQGPTAFTEDLTSDLPISTTLNIPGEVYPTTSVTPEEPIAVGVTSGSSSEPASSTEEVIPAAMSVRTNEAPVTMRKPEDSEIPEHHPVGSGTPEGISHSGDDKEYQEFLRELDLESDPEARAQPEFEPTMEVVEPQSTFAAPSHKDIAEIAKKRADIVGRHVRWEQKLFELVEKVNSTFLGDLELLRASHVAIFKSAGGDPFGVLKLQNETAKALRNTENYLKNLMADAQKINKEKQRLWEKVTARVEDKFDSRVQQIEEEAKVWWQEVTEQEMALVRASYAKIKSMALDAQADIGMDYAWLDDVTYQDWQRYHSLMDIAEDNGKYFQSLQDGSHPDSPINNPLTLMMDLQNEVQDIADGFEVRFTEVTRRGHQTLSGEIETSPEPVVSVLKPVPPQEHAVSVGDIGDTLLSRSAEEVVAALERAEQTSDTSPAPSDSSVAELPKGQPTPTADDSINTNSETESLILPLVGEEDGPTKSAGSALSREMGHIEHVIASQSVAEERLVSLPTGSEPVFSIQPVPENEAVFILQRSKEEIEGALSRSARNAAEETENRV